MIIDIPTPNDFKHAGISYLNIAWGIVLDLATDLEIARVDEWDSTGEVSDEYWGAAQKPLATVTSLLQQGIEFLIKSRVADVSPFLLIDGSPRDWPKKCNKRDTPFSEFKSIDAQELIRAHDTISKYPFTDQFINLYENIRVRRNTIMHTVDPKLRFTSLDIILNILESSEILLGPQQWIKIREAYLEQDPISVVHSTDSVGIRLIDECLNLIDNLKASELKKYFDFHTRQRRYFCYTCQKEDQTGMLAVTTAQLKPNTPSSKYVFCFVCRRTSEVIRTSCSDKSCRGNVIDAIDGTCLTCFR